MTVCKVCKIDKSTDNFNKSAFFQKAKRPKCFTCLEANVKYTITRLYNTWRGMKERCTSPKHKNYTLYKDRWYKPWDDFHIFRLWAETTSYEEGLTIDRIDSEKGYSPDNCQFITAKENTIKGNKERSIRNKLKLDNYINKC